MSGYTTGVRAEVLRQRREGYTLAAIADATGVSRSQVHRWCVRAEDERARLERAVNAQRAARRRRRAALATLAAPRVIPAGGCGHTVLMGPVCGSCRVDVVRGLAVVA